MEEVQDVAKPPCAILGTEGNLYALIGAVSTTLQDAGLPELADDFVRQVVSLQTYDEVLGLSQTYVECE